MGLISRPPMERWSAGRVVLVGDARHPMLPFSGRKGLVVEQRRTRSRWPGLPGGESRDDHVTAFANYEAEHVAARQAAAILRQSETARSSIRHV